MREIVWTLAVALALVGCKSKSSDEPAPASGSAAQNATSASSSGAASAKTGDAGKTESDADKKEHAHFLAALAKARGDVAKKNYEAALAAYDEALKHAPHDAAVIGERGYVRFLSGDDSGAERDLTAARDLGAAPKVAAQIWFNLGLVRARRGDGEGARSAFATSQSISPSAAAEKKLAGLSLCTAELSNGDGNLKKVSGFPEAASFMSVDPGAVADAGAKGAVCIQSFTADGSGDTHGVCDGPPPWLVSHDHFSFFQHVDILFPASAPANALYVADVGQQGDWPAHCTGATDFKAEIDGKFGWITKIFNGAGAVMIEHGGDTKGAQGLSDMGDYFCANGVGSFDDTFYNLDTGEVLLNVRRPIAVNATAPVATVALKNGVVIIGGAGCNEPIDLKLGKLARDGGK